MLSWVYPVRVVQALFALASIGVTAYGSCALPAKKKKKAKQPPPVIASLYSKWSFSNTIYYMLFNGCWTTVVAVPYLGLAPLWLARVSHEFVIPAIEIITMCLWLSGWIALAAQIPSPGACDSSNCHGLQALIVVAAVEWWVLHPRHISWNWHSANILTRALFLFTNVFAVLDLVSSRRNRSDRKARSTAQSETHSDQPQMTSVEETV